MRQIEKGEYPARPETPYPLHQREVFSMLTDNSAARTRDVRRPARRGVSERSIIEEARALVPTIDLAQRLCGPTALRKIGEKWTAHCPLPGHDERTPSFTVYEDPARGWWCFGCQRGSDVVDLARYAWGIDRADVAAAEVLLEFGYEIHNPRPQSWHDKQERQQPVRDAIENEQVRYYARRLYRRLCVPTLRGITDELERKEEADLLWDSCLSVARIAQSRRRAS